MSGKGPYLTLACAAGLFVTLLIVNLANNPREDDSPGSEYGGRPAVGAPAGWVDDVGATRGTSR